MNTKFAKPSILGKPVLQPYRNQSVVRQPTAFKSEQPRISKQRFASQVDMKHVLSKPVTAHYLSKEKRLCYSSAGTSINVQEEQTLDLNAGTPFNLKKERIKVWIKENVISERPRWRWRHLIPAESDSLPHAHTQTTKTYYKHQDSSIKKAQVLKIKTSGNSDIKDNSLETKLQGRLLASFQDDAKYEHVGQDTRSQGGKDD
ncbi:hypothetical protein Tco_0227890 [Tanacetum coccineum]